MRFKPFVRARPSVIGRVDIRGPWRGPSPDVRSSLRQRGHNGVAEGGEVVRETGRDQVPVHDAVLVHTISYGIDAIVPHDRIRRHLATYQDDTNTRIPGRV